MSTATTNRIAQLKLALHELQVIGCETPSDDIGNAIEDTRKELDALQCWVCEDAPAVTTHEGHRVCDECLDHFTPGPSRRLDYTDSATANDMRFGTDEDF